MNLGRPEPRSAVPPEFEQKVAHVLVRWLLVILAFHFVALSSVPPSELNWSVRISFLFILSNVALMWAPRHFFKHPRFTRTLHAGDFAFIAVALYFVREPGSSYHWVFMAHLVLLAWLRKVGLVVAILAAAFTATGIIGGVTTGRWLPFSDAGDFLRSSILFAVAVLYFLLIELLHRNSTLFHVVARAKAEWERTADSMSELILLVDQDGKVRRVNRALAGRLGKKPAELVGRSWHAVLDATEFPPADSPLSRMFVSRAAVEGRYLHSALGAEAQVSALPVFDGDALVEAVYVLRM